jgi:CheY-like chemotaxis protein
MGELRARPHRILLRAEVTWAEHRAIGHTLTVSNDAAFIEIEHRPAVGAEVHVRLSFPRFFQALESAARVTASAAGERPGNVSGIDVHFVHRSDAERERFAAALDRLDRIPPAGGDDVCYRVLIVEDNEMIRDMFAYGVDKYFRGHHARVTVDTAVDGAEGWVRLQDTEYDLAIVDHYLPVLDGASLLARVRREPKLSALPLIGMSVGGYEVRDAMMEAGADLFLTKPIVLRDLFQTLERLAAAGEVH